MAAKDAPWPVQYAGRYGFPGLVLCALAYWGSGQVEWFKEKVAQPAIIQHVETMKNLGEATANNSVTLQRIQETQEEIHETVKGIAVTQGRLEKIISDRKELASQQQFECDP